jgi:hypothetical protein
MQHLMTMARTIRLYALPDAPRTPGMRPLEGRDVPAACKLLNEYLEKCAIYYAAFICFLFHFSSTPPTDSPCIRTLRKPSSLTHCSRGLASLMRTSSKGPAVWASPASLHSTTYRQACLVRRASAHENHLMCSRLFAAILAFYPAGLQGTPDTARCMPCIPFITSPGRMAWRQS